MLRRRAALALVWEQVWQGLWRPACIVGLFLGLSWTGVWLGVPHAVRVIGVGLFALAILASLWPMRRLRWPSDAAAYGRIDARSDLRHRPAATLRDSLASGAADPTTSALWALHRRRAEAAVASLRAGAPRPRLPEHDRFALRAGVLLLLAATAIVAGPERYARTVAAFDWSGTTTAGAGARLDAWLDPPRYTGRPPLVLDTAAGSAPQQVAAPIGSVLVVRSSDGAVTLDGGAGLQPFAADPDASPATPPTAPASASGGVEERRVLRADTHLTLKAAGGRGVYDISAIPDRPPHIALTAAPKMNSRGTMGLAYETSDDYGVAGAEAQFSAPVVDGRPPSRRSLVPAPVAPLALPAGAGNGGRAETTIDLSDNPWAGARVAMTLVARDEGGNTGRSDPVQIVLPERAWTKPLARALAEQRRALVLAPDERSRVDTSLEALSLAPEAYGTTASLYLGLRVAREQLRLARTDADLVDVADLLWQMALQIETGDQSDAEKALRQAEEKLQSALANGASDEEIAQLTAEMRAAMDKFLKQLAQRQQREGGAPPESGGAGRSVTPKDLQAMLDRMRDAARGGDRADAQRTLDRLRDMLDNLQTANRGSGRQGREMARALSDLDKLTREQQQLRDDTYQKGRGAPQAGPDGLRGDEADDEDDAEAGDPNGGSGLGEGDRQDLQKRQGALRDKLGDLQKRLGELGQDADQLGSAKGAMGEAGDALSPGGRSGSAVDAQGRALKAMRDGASRLAQAMNGNGPGEGSAGEDGEGADGQQPGGGTAGDTDPLGRPTPRNPLYSRGARYDPLGAPAAQRAQRVLEELRRRLSDPARPRDETDYLERLLRRY